jgi:hypothetical protein
MTAYHYIAFVHFTLVYDVTGHIYNSVLRLYSMFTVLLCNRTNVLLSVQRESYEHYTVIYKRLVNAIYTFVFKACFIIRNDNCMTKFKESNPVKYNLF